jgi:hypothetical protein
MNVWKSHAIPASALSNFRFRRRLSLSPQQWACTRRCRSRGEGAFALSRRSLGEIFYGSAGVSSNLRITTVMSDALKDPDSLKALAGDRLVAVASSPMNSLRSCMPRSQNGASSSAK